MRTRILSVAVLISTVAANVFACPGCKEAIKGEGGFFASGFNWSIVFMLGVFCTLLGTVCYKIFRIIQREAAATAHDPESIHSSKGHWMTVTLPAVGVGLVVLMVMGSVNAESTSESSGTKYASEELVQNDIAKADGDLLITFKSETCGICKQMKPTMDKLEGGYGSKVRMLYVNTTESKKLAENFSVDDLPCSVFVHNGKEVARRAGLCSESEFKSWLDERLK